MQLSLNPDWPAAQQRWADFWAGHHRGRPVMYLTAPRENPQPLPEPTSLEQVYFDPEFIYASHAARLRNQHFLAEALPHAAPIMAGWLPAYGARLELRPDTIWFEPLVEDWDAAPDWDDWSGPQFRQLLDIVGEVGARAAGEFMVGIPATLPPNDLLSVLREPRRFLLDLVLEPDRVRDALARMTRSYLRQHRELTQVVQRQYQGLCHHYPCWGPQVVSFQSDVSCMLSGAMFEEFIVPELETISAELGPAIYHLDGPDAIRHLPRLCDIPGIRMIQWVPGAGQPGSFEHWPQVFEYAQQRGKAILLPIGPQQLELAIKTFRPDLTFMMCGAASYDDACRLIEDAERYTKEYWG
jgi:hypothetical protein